VPPSTGHGMPHFTHPIDPIVGLVQLFDHRNQCCIPLGALTSRPGFGSTISSGGNEPTICRTQHATDGLDSETISEHVNVSDHLVVGRSSSAAKKADAVLRISLARRSSA